MRKYVKNHGIIFGGPQNFVGFSTGPGLEKVGKRCFNIFSKFSLNKFIDFVFFFINYPLEIKIALFSTTFSL
jgi:hypothetical protein